MDEKAPILLNIDVDDDTIRLRIDDELTNFDLGKESIHEITLYNYSINAELIADMNELPMRVFEYEICEYGDKRKLEFVSDYGKIIDEIEFESFTETFGKYTENDFVKKGKVIYDFYTHLYKAFTHNDSIFYSTTEKLKFEIENDVERLKRKTEFFENSNPTKSEVYRSQIKQLEKYLYILKNNNQS